MQQQVGALVLRACMRARCARRLPACAVRKRLPMFERRHECMRPPNPRQGRDGEWLHAVIPLPQAGAETNARNTGQDIRPGSTHSLGGDICPNREALPAPLPMHAFIPPALQTPNTASAGPRPPPPAQSSAGELAAHL